MQELTQMCDARAQTEIKIQTHDLTVQTHLPFSPVDELSEPFLGQGSLWYVALSFH